jgi:hypothetical protein
MTEVGCAAFTISEHEGLRMTILDPITGNRVTITTSSWPRR